MRIATVLFRVVLGLTAGLLLLLIAGYLIMRTSLPQTSGRLELAGLQDPVTVTRDAHGVPHIQAASHEDAYRALGYVHAQDRLWQMEFQRLVAAGRLSEAVGEAGLSTDRFIRTLGVRQAAESAWAALDDGELRRWLQAYVAGVNAYLDTHNGVLPAEFLLLGHRPEPFTPADVIGWGKMMAWDLAGNWNDELLRGRLLAEHSEQEVRELWPEWPGDMHITIEGDWTMPDPEEEADGPVPAGVGDVAPEAGDGAGDGGQELDDSDDGAEEDPGQLLRRFDLEALAAAFRPRLSEDAGSNAWVLSGEHTVSGLPLLANDPHLGLQTPSLWYLVHLEAPGLNVIGASLPGTPAVLLGRNDNIAWGFTNTGTDVQDVYIERLSPTDDSSYLTPDGYEQFTVRNEVIRVKGGPDVELTVRETRNGPVISDLVPDLGSYPETAGDRYVLSLRWTALDETDGTVGAVMRLNHARDWAAFNSALEQFQNPQQNIMYADTEGNIGFLAAGSVPIRAAGDGFAPVPGWTGEYDWTGYVPFEELPRSYNPPSGRIVNANQQVTPEDYPYLLTRDWAVPYRADRIVELLDSLDRHSVASSVRIQGDQVSLFSRELAAELLELRFTEPGLAALQAELFAWDGTMDADSIAPLITAAFQREFLPLVFNDRLAGNFSDWAGNRPVVLLSLLRGADSACPEPGCTELAERAFRQAAAWLEEQLGSDRTAWRWADLHRVVQEHAVLTASPLSAIADLQIENGGGAYTVNAARYDLLGSDAPFRQTEGPGYRTVMDLGDTAGSVFMQSTGQSGNLLSRHYRDLQTPWRDNRALTMNINATADGEVLELVPVR